MMKTVVFLFAGFSNSHAFNILFDSQSAFDRSLLWANQIDNLQKIVVATVPQTKSFVEKAVASSAIKNISVIEKPHWNTTLLLEELTSSCASCGAERAVYSSADKPFLSKELTLQVLNAHKEYLAEYTFADGYPSGFAPEVIAKGTLSILAELSKTSQKSAGESSVSAGCIFNVLKGDINSFEIETVIAPKDYRMLRLDFSCSTKAGFVACKNLYELAKEKNINLDAQSLSDLAEVSSKVQHTVPAFYNIQIAENCASNSIYNPYPQSFKFHKGVLPFVEENPNPKNMELSSFSSIIKQIAELSEEAVIGFGNLSEPLTVVNIEDYIKEVLKYPMLSVLIETDGILVTEELVSRIANVVKEAEPRLNAKEAVTWIVSIDAVTNETYKVLHLKPELDKATNALYLLAKEFPKSVYPQFLRMNKNESELEAFYRLYHKEDSVSFGKLIIQKFDSFCGLLSDEKPADLSPLERNVCWHLKRDLTILPDGNVPMCRECLLESYIGNVFEENLEAVWQKSLGLVQNQINKEYEQKCRSCDEYYTFNF